MLEIGLVDPLEEISARNPEPRRAYVLVSKKRLDGSYDGLIMFRERARLLVPVIEYQFTWELACELVIQRRFKLFHRARMARHGGVHTIGHNSVFRDLFGYRIK